MKTVKPCSIAPKHSWAFVRNVQVGSMTAGRHGQIAQFPLKGLYRCQCGAVKHGPFDPNGADLRALAPRRLMGGES